jgi:HD-GYP domain-containing protein (c-di-GMP phosphodiesterase class II)
MPPLTLTNLTPHEEALALDERIPTSTEARIEVLLVAVLAAAVGALYLFAPADRSVDPVLVALSVALIALAHLPRFDLRFAWTAPVQLALVPTLFLVPAWLVPVTMAAGIVVSRLPEVLRGQLAATRLLLAPGNAWFTVGPAAVLAAAGSPGPAEAGVAVLAAMLAAQIGTDFVVSVIWHWLTVRAPLAVQIREAIFVYAIDAALAPVGLLSALAIDESPYYIALMVPLFGVLAVFASERRARLAQLTELNGAYRGTAMVLAEVVDADDAYTGMHTRDVVDLSVAVATWMGLEDEQRRTVEFGALLHDVGKVVIPKEIVNKPGPLDDAEWKLMRTHTIAGQRMLDRVGGAMRQVGAIVRASHERWDGTGYPDGLAGEQIPLEARIICACDAYNAMTTTRPYREAMAPGAAAAELVRCSGTQFDPAVVEAVLAVAGVQPAEPRDSDLLAA